MNDKNFVIAIGENKYISKAVFRWFGFKFETTEHFWQAKEFTEAEAKALVGWQFYKPKKRGKVVEVKREKSRWAGMTIWDTYVGEKHEHRELLGSVLDTRGNYALELDDGSRLTVQEARLGETTDPVFFLRFQSEKQAQDFAERFLSDDYVVKIVPVSSVEETIKSTYGFRRLSSVSECELDKMIDAYIDGGWTLKGGRKDDYYYANQCVIRTRGEHE